MKLTIQDIEQAKKISTKKVEEGYMVIHFSYNSVVVKYTDGLNILKGFNSAEMYKDSYSDGPSITSLAKDEIKSNVISAQTYQTAKLASILNITSKRLEELLEAQKSMEKNDPEDV